MLMPIFECTCRYKCCCKRASPHTVLAAAIYSLEHGLRTFTAVPRSAQPSVFRGTVKQEAQLSPSDRAMRLVSSNLANCHATVQKLLIRQVLVTG